MSFFTWLSSYYNVRVFGFVVLFFMVISLAFGIIAVSLHNLYSANWAGQNGFQDGSADIGAFTFCLDAEGISPTSGLVFVAHTCSSIDSNCIFTLSYMEDGVSKTFSGSPPNFNCSQYNAFRAFFILGIIFTGFALITAAVQLFYKTDVNGEGRIWKILTEVFGWTAVLSIVITYGLVADHMNNFDQNNVLSEGTAFALEVTAWVVQIIAMLIYTVIIIMEGRTEGKEGKGSGKMFGAAQNSKDQTTPASDSDTVETTDSSA